MQYIVRSNTSEQIILEISNFLMNVNKFMVENQSYIQAFTDLKLKFIFDVYTEVVKHSWTIYTKNL